MHTAKHYAVPVIEKATPEPTPDKLVMPALEQERVPRGSRSRGGAMTKQKYVKEIEKIIAEHQQVQMSHPQSSEQWQNASVEINRLAALIVEAL